MGFVPLKAAAMGWAPQDATEPDTDAWLSAGGDPMNPQTPGCPRHEWVPPKFCLLSPLHRLQAQPSPCLSGAPTLPGASSTRCTAGAGPRPEKAPARSPPAFSLPLPGSIRCSPDQLEPGGPSWDLFQLPAPPRRQAGDGAALACFLSLLAADGRAPALRGTPALTSGPPTVAGCPWLQVLGHSTGGRGGWSRVLPPAPIPFREALQGAGDQQTPRVPPKHPTLSVCTHGCSLCTHSPSYWGCGAEFSPWHKGKVPGVSQAVFESGGNHPKPHI